MIDQENHIGVRSGGLRIKASGSYEGTSIPLRLKLP
jgi:hypothetical protein